MEVNKIECVIWNHP